MGGRGATSGFTTNADDKKNSLADEATEWYVSGDDMWINQYLRGDLSFGELSKNEKALLKGLDIATNGSIAADTLYRAVDAQAVFGRMSDDDFYNLESAIVYGNNDRYAKNALNQFTKGIKGKTLTEKGFMSTTINKQQALDWNGFTGSSKDIVIQFDAKGQKLSGKDLTKHDMQQSEMLLKRGQKYTVTGVTAKHGKIWVTAKFV